MGKFCNCGSTTTIGGCDDDDDDCGIMGGCCCGGGGCDIMVDGGWDVWGLRPTGGCDICCCCCR